MQTTLAQLCDELCHMQKSIPKTDSFPVIQNLFSVELHAETLLNIIYIFHFE